jgi:hypothetical protein
MEGHWHKLAVEVLQKGTNRDFKMLLKEENPHARAVGLYCLARSKQPGAAPILKQFLNDKTEIGLQEFGCIVNNDILGTFAARLRHDANYLERPGPVCPLMEPQEIAAIHIPPLADDHGKAGSAGHYDSLFVHWLAKEQPRAFTLEELERAMPKLRAYQIVKGIGRSTPSREIRLVLVQWLNDRALDETTRLAAASALTRDPDPAAQKALESARGFLQEALGAPRAAALIEAAALRRQFHETLESCTPRPDEASHWFSAPFGKAFLVPHPMVLERLPRLEPWDTNTKLACGIGRVLLSNSERLSEVVDDWNTYSWMPYLFQGKLACREVELATLSAGQRQLMRQRCNNALELHGRKIRPVPIERKTP